MRGPQGFSAETPVCDREMLGPSMASRIASQPVLIVEPNARIRELIRALLEQSGFSPATTGDVEVADRLARNFNVGAILRDLNLAPAVKDRTLKDLEATPSDLLKRTILMTTAVKAANGAIPSGTVFAIIEKPFDIEQMVKMVRACLESSEERPAPGARAIRRGHDPRS